MSGELKRTRRRGVVWASAWAIVLTAFSMVTGQPAFVDEEGWPGVTRLRLRRKADKRRGLTAALSIGDRGTASGPIRVLQDRAEEEYRAGNREKAEELLLEATHLPECPPAIWSNLGQVRMDCKNYRTAADAYSHAIHGFSHEVERQAEALWCRGLAYDRQGLVTRARTDYTAALHLSPNDVDVLVNIGTLELDDGRPKTARRYLARAAAVDAKANWQLADIHIERGQAEQARRLLQLAVNAGETRALRDLAYLAQQDGDKTAAKHLLIRAIDLDVPGAEEQLTELT